MRPEWLILCLDKAPGGVQKKGVIENQYVPLLITMAAAGVVAGGLLFAATFFGPKKPSPVKSQPFECGMEPLSNPNRPLHLQFYMVAMLFVVFDVEIVFFYPWATLIRELGRFGLIEMGCFAGFLLLGLAYAWRKGALEFT